MFVRRLAVLTAILALAVGACTSGSSTSPSAPPASLNANQSAAASPESAAPVTIEWWHNADKDPGKSIWQKAADDYHAAHPNVTIKVTALQNEDFKTKIPLALSGSTPPDIYQSWGGGGLLEQVNAGKVQDITAAVAPWIGDINPPAASLYQVDGKQYGMPYDLGLVGFWYNKALFTKAGITSPPTTWDDLIADTGKLKTAGIAPISVGQKDKWPGAFYWEYLAIRECGRDLMENAVKTNSFDDPCFVKAGQDLQKLVDAKPFNDGFLNTPAQAVPGSAAGLIANVKVAIELQGQWEPGVMPPLTPDKKGLGNDLGWFPFPAVTGGAGDLTDGLGGGNGFAVSKDAPPEAVDFLKYINGSEVMSVWGSRSSETGILPVVKGADTTVTDPNLKELLDNRSKSTYVQLYLDQAFPAAVGLALNDAIAGLFAGTSTPEQVVQDIKAAGG